MKKGDLRQKDFNDFVAIAKKLSGDSKTNRYSKESKKLERTFKSKKYAKLVAKREKDDVKKLKKQQKSKNIERKIDRDLIIQREISTTIQKASKLDDLRALWETNGFSKSEFEKLVKQYQGNVSEIKKAVQTAINQKKSNVGLDKQGSVINKFNSELNKLSDRIFSYNNFVSLFANTANVPYRVAQGTIKKNGLWDKYNDATFEELKEANPTLNKTKFNEISKKNKKKEKSIPVIVKKVGSKSETTTTETTTSPKQKINLNKVDFTNEYQANDLVNEVGARKPILTNLMEYFFLSFYFFY